MFCIKCGKEIEDSAAFCRYCGAATAGNGAGNRENVALGNAGKSDKARKKSHTGIYVAVAAGVLLAGIIGGFFLFREILGGNGTGEDRLLADGTPAGSAEDENWQELKPLYEAVEVPVIDIHAVNYTAGTKSPGIVWDSTLFYWLEDVDQESSEDGYLTKCPVGRMLFRSAEDGSLIQYEIYLDPETGEIYKIVSVEKRAEELHLTDYYYQNGNPNFTFSRNDSVYTPTYATTEKTGERYYFDKDVMARWRMIEEPRIIEEYVLTLNDAYYSQYDYYEQSGETQRRYDETESRELNAARNTFDAVTAAGAGVGLVEGRVTDAAGNPLAGMTVDILREEDGTLLYRGETAEDGSFQIYVHLEDVLCRVVVRGNEVYASNSVEGVKLSGVTGGSSCGSLLLNRVGGEEYPVHINVYDAAQVWTEEDGGLIRDQLPGAEVSLRAGAGVRIGEILQTLAADKAGEIRTALHAGTYTAQIDVPGYVSSYVTVEVAEKETEVEGYVLPVPEAGQTGIILSWEGEADLDLTLFTPYQSTDGDMAHIGGRTAGDSYGNRLVADNTAYCEVMYVNTGEAGNYKLYVNNYTQSEAENYSSDQLGGLNVHIYIYDSTGLLGEFSFPAGESGVVWEVAELNGSRITPAQRVYRNLAGKKWWTQDKYVLDMEDSDDALSNSSLRKTIKVGIINHNPDESGYRTINDADLKKTFTAENGYDASFAYSNKGNEQIAAAQKFIQDGVDYLLLSAADTFGWDSTLQDAKAADVKVILFDRVIDADKSLYEASIVSDMTVEGQQAVDWLKSQGLGEYSIIHLQGVIGTEAQKGRSGALDAAVSSEGWTLVTQQSAEWNAESAQQIVQSVIDSGRYFNVIYAENDDMARGAVAALDASNISHGVGKDVIIMSFDCNRWALQELLDQHWNYDGQCSPFQASYIDDVIKTLESGDSITNKTIIIDEKGFDARTITADDVANYGI